VLFYGQDDAGAGLARVFILIETPDFHSSGGFCHQPRKDVDQRGFSSAVRTKQAKDRPVRHAKVNAIQRVLGRCAFGGRIGLAQTCDFEGIFTHAL